jgi:hypothetical protein
MDVDKIIKSMFHVKRGDTLPYAGWLKSTRKDLSILFRDLNYSYGAEIGVLAGRHAKEMLRINPNLHLILVDPWKGFSRRSNDAYVEKAFQTCKERLSSWNPEYMRMCSMDAVEKINDGSLDFIYIDGMHNFDNVMMDLIRWTPKVRIGGIVSGHDYFHSFRYGVVNAVNAYTYAHNITKWYITGGAGGFERHPSYFWVKK